MTQCLFLHLVILLFPGAATALVPQTVKLTATPARTRVQIADPFEFKIEVVAAVGMRVEFPASPEMLGPFDVLETADENDIPSGNDSNTRLWTRFLLLETIETGDLEIPEVEVTVTQPGQQSKTMSTKGCPITVQASIADDANLTEFHDIADLHNVDPPPGKFHGWAWGLAAVLVGSLLAVGIVFTLRKRKSPFSPLRWALNKLDHHSNGDIAQVEKTLRRYMQDTFQFPAESLPPNSILQSLKSAAVKPELLKKVNQLLVRFEQVKFGGLQLSDTETNRLLTGTRRAIEELDEYTESA